MPHSKSHLPHPTFHIPPSTSHLPHPTSHIPHSTSNTPHSTFSTSLSACEISVPILRTGGAICVVDKHPAWFLCRSVASAGEIFLCRMAHSPFRRSPCEGHIPHSQHSSPKSTRFFPSRPAPCPNTPFSARHCNRLTISHLPSKDPRATFQTLHSPPRNAIFRPSIPALSRLHPLPFAPRSLSPRTPIHAQRPSHPSAYGLFPPSPFRLRTPKPRLPALCFTQNPDTRFAPNIFNVVWFSLYRLLGVERGMIYQVDSWIDGLGMMQKCNERSTFAVVAQSAAVEQATE